MDWLYRLLLVKHVRDVSACAGVMHESDMLFTRVELDRADRVEFQMCLMLAELMEMSEQEEL